MMISTQWIIIEAESQSRIPKNSEMCAFAINASDAMETIEPTIVTNSLLEPPPHANTADSSTILQSNVHITQQKVIPGLLLDPNLPTPKIND